MVKCEQLTTIDKSLLLRGSFAGKISNKKIEEIEKAVRIAIGV